MVLLEESTDILFPGLGINLTNVGDGFSIFGFKIFFYGTCIALGMLLGYLISAWQAKRTKQDPDFYLDFAVVAIIISVICARLYYVIFRWEMFSDNPMSIFNLRTGGLAIYGGVIGGISTAYVWCKIKKYSFGLLADTACLGLLTGQILGRWGNFFNREAFGSYCSGFTRMLVNVKDASYYFDPDRCSLQALRDAYVGKEQALNRIIEIRDNIQVIDGQSYISVHPTFFYESFLNLVLLIIIIHYTRHKRNNGEQICMYVGGYGLIRFFVEGLRSDQLFLWGTGIAVSQALALLMFFVGAGMFIYLRFYKKPSEKVEEKVEEEGVKENA